MMFTPIERGEAAPTAVRCLGLQSPSLGRYIRRPIAEGVDDGDDADEDRD